LKSEVEYILPGLNFIDSYTDTILLLIFLTMFFLNMVKKRKKGYYLLRVLRRLVLLVVFFLRLVVVRLFLRIAILKDQFKELILLFHQHLLQ